MRRLVRVLSWIASSFLALVLLLVVVLAVGGCYGRHHSAWPAPVPGVRLEPTRPILRAADITTNNACFFLLQATNYLAKTNPSIVWDYTEWEAFTSNGWSPGRFTNLDAQAAVTAPAFDLLARAAAMTNGQVESVTSVTQMTPFITAHLRFARLQSYRMARAIGEGRVDEGLSVAGCQFANDAHLERGGCLIACLVAVASDQVILRELHRALAEGRLPASALRNAAAVIAGRLANREPFAEAMRYEAVMALDALKYVYEDGFAIISHLSNEGYEPRSHLGWTLARAPLALVGSSEANTRRHLSAVYSRVIDRADQPWRMREFERTEPILQKVSFESPAAYFDDPLGRLFAAMLLPALSSSSDRHASNLASMESLRVLLLAELRRQERGEWPARIEDLVPDYLSAVPRDPFVADGFIRLAHAGDHLAAYSVGPNEVDDGGVLDPLAEVPARQPDVGWRIDLAPASP